MLNSEVRPIFRLLNQNQIEVLLEEAYLICYEVGQRIYSDEALKLFKSSGCMIEGNVVKIPKDIILAALGKIPNEFKLYSRDGDYFLNIGERNSYFGTGVTTPNILDIYSGQRRPFLTRDIELSARVADELENIDFVMPLGYVSDVRAEFADVYHFLFTIKNTKKPVPFICYDEFGLETIVEMASKISGSLKNLKEKPFLITYCQSTPALMHDKFALEKLIKSVKLGIPTIYYSAPVVGSNSPCTYAGAIAQSLAEDFLGLVLAQLVKEGSVIISGMASHPIDFKTGNLSIGAPELSIGGCAVAEIFQYLHIPTFAAAGLSDSKTFDEQSAIESCFSIILHLLSGNNIIHDQGYLESGMVGSISNIVMGDEIIGMARRFTRGFNINNETMAFELIKSKGPGASYLQELHTLNNFKKEFWFPNLMDRDMYSIWTRKGCKNFKEKAFDKARVFASNKNKSEINSKLFEELVEIKIKSEKFRDNIYKNT